MNPAAICGFNRALLQLSTRLSHFAKAFWYAWLGLFGMSGFLLLVYLTADAQEISLPVFGSDGVTFAALFLALSAGLGLVFWALLKGVHLVIHVALRRGWVGTVGT